MRLTTLVLAMTLIVLMFIIAQEKDLREDLSKCETSLKESIPKPVPNICADLIICTEPPRSF